MASIRKRGSNSYLIVVSRGYDYEGNRLKSVQKTVKPPKEYTPKQAEKWVKEQAILFEREVQHSPEPINRSITLAKYIEHWAADVGPKKLADSTFRRDEQDIRRILPALGNYKLTDLRKEVIREFYEKMRHTPRLDGRGNLSEKSVEGLHNTLCSVLSSAVDEGYAKTGEALHACRESCRSYMNNYAHYTVSMGQSERCTEVAQIGALLQQADRAECRKLFEGSGMCLKYQAEERPDAARKAWQNKVRSLLEKGMEPMQRTALQQAVDAIFDSAGAAGLAAWEYFDTAEQCLRDFCAWSLGHGMEIRRDWADSKREKVRSAASVHQLAQWLAATLCAKQEELYAQRVHAEEYPIRLAIEYMKKHYAEKITLEDVAAHSGFNPTYFSEKFKEKTGKNFTDFLTEVRMEAAKELLRDSRKTIGQIGDAVGYKDAKYFSQQFTKCVGMKPTEYRKLYY